ncbi:putative cytochrome P450 [Actinacidiphila reveromycinica]|uniref:Putative cytochrome P450 n=1 Tax=Actinacidiphila reveromycinica TaxID=659352 RepID=A0A7U3UP35_9ACTN|nr:cytochrome P450 [Streptomyces sp. SN-593]BBA96111.1 putative cytochrome P450 [Streptomyces sp. SN-593]
MHFARTAPPARRTLDRRVKQVVRWGTSHALPRTAVALGARRGDLQGRLVAQMSNGTSAELFTLLDEIRGKGPVFLSKLGAVVASHEAVRETLANPDVEAGRFVPPDSVLARIGAWSEIDVLHPVRPPSLLAVEPPQHTRYRKLVTKVFSARAVAQLKDRTQQIADELVAAIPAGEPGDLIASYCALLPVTVICEILGVPPGERHRVLELGEAAAPSLDLGLPWREFRRVESALATFDRWLTGHLDRLRAQPGDDLLSQLVTAQEDGAGLTDQEVKSTAGLVLAAGFETTVNLLGNGIALLAADPAQRALLRERPDLWDNAVNEILRYDPPVLLTGRMTVRRTTIAGAGVPAGRLVSVALAGANRDPDVFPRPHVFDVTRDNARDHLSFGAGRHYCLGASLARMEGAIGLRTLFERFPAVELRPGARRRPTRILRGYGTLPAVARTR